MKKIGVLTFWGVPNYGAFAQAYALNKILKDCYKNAEVVHLAYLHTKHKKLYFKKRRPKIVSARSLLSIEYYKSLIGYCLNPAIRYHEFDKDWNSIHHVLLSKKSCLEKYYCDVIITGSDAIWEYSVPAFGNDEHLIGNKLNCKKLVSYAASFGNMDPDSNFKPFIKNGLKNYDAISVRDETSRIIVDKLLSKTVAVEVIDPTLVYDFRSDPNIPISSYERYILVYGNDFSEILINEVVGYAKEHKLTIIGAGIAPSWCDVRLTDIGPLAWIGMFQNAEFVVTCTFHGLMFSINYEKKIVFNQVAYVKNRSTTLLEKLGLYELYKNGTTLHQVLDYDWNYAEINKKLDGLRLESMVFLRGLRLDE